MGKRLPAVVLLLLLSLLSGCVSRKPLILAAGPVGGAAYERGSRAADIIGDTAVLPTSGPGASLARLREGKADLALVRADLLEQDESGLAVLCVLYAMPLQWIQGVTGADQMQTIPSGGVESLLAQSLPGLEDAEELSIGDCLNLYLDKRVGGILIVAGAPDVRVMEAGVTRDSRLVSLSEEIKEDLMARHVWLVEDTLVAGTYPWQKETVDTLGIPVLLVARENLPSDRVKGLLSALDRSGEYDEGGLQAPGWLLLHGAAADYFNQE